jgi:hypothetical protein
MRDIFARFAFVPRSRVSQRYRPVLELWHELLAQLVENREAALGNISSAYVIEQGTPPALLTRGRC